MYKKRLYSSVNGRPLDPNIDLLCDVEGANKAIALKGIANP